MTAGSIVSNIEMPTEIKKVLHLRSESNESAICGKSWVTGILILLIESQQDIEDFIKQSGPNYELCGKCEERTDLVILAEIEL